MRMWMVDPKIMCRQHLLGEHAELHMLIGTLQKGISVKGYLDDNLMEPESMYSRHDELVAEMGARGYNHKSPMKLLSVNMSRKIDREAALRELLRRCPECRSGYNQLKYQESLTNVYPTSPK